MVTSTDVLSALKPALHEVKVGEATLYVRGLTGRQRAQLIARAKSDNPMQAWDLVQQCACNERGDPLFSAEQVEELATADAALLEEIAAAILGASKLLPEQQEQAAKN